MSEKQYGVVAPDVLVSYSGLDFLQAMIDGKVPNPPISQVLDFHLAEVSEGHAVFEGMPAASFYNPIGTVHGGFAMTLLDSAMTCAVLSVLAAGGATVETKVNFVRPLLPSTGPVRALASIVHAGARLATAEGRLVDAAGRLYAHGSTTCLRFPL